MRYQRRRRRKYQCRPTRHYRCVKGRRKLSKRARRRGKLRRRLHGSRKYKGVRRNMTFPWLTNAQVAKLSDDQIWDMATRSGALY